MVRPTSIPQHHPGKGSLSMDQASPARTVALPLALRWRSRFPKPTFHLLVGWFKVLVLVSNLIAVYCLTPGQPADHLPLVKSLATHVPYYCSHRWATTMLAQAL